ncbi:unnamed protein product, partial [Porites evermanni]
RLLLTLLSKGRDNLDFARNSTSEVPEEPHPPKNTPQWCRCGVCRPVPDEHEDLCWKRGTFLRSYRIFSTISLLEVCIKAEAIFRLKRSAFDLSVCRVLEKPHIASLPFEDMVN